MNAAKKNIQKAYGIKQGRCDNIKNKLYNQGLTVLKAVELHIQQIEELKMTDEQFFINWEDEINKLSIKDHASPK